MGAHSDAAQIGQRGDDAHRAVAAHAKVAGVVEKDHAGRAGRVYGFAQQGADYDVAAARLQDGGGAPGVVLGA